MRQTILTLSLLCGVAAAQVDDRVLWRFELDSPIGGREVAVGPDGAIYASDDTALYAINSNGSLRWTRPGLGGGGAITFLADGAIVVGSDQTVWALETDGQTRWAFEYDGNGGLEHIEVGPSVGPDGNIYGVTSVDGPFGLGAFSLTPAGAMRWSDRGSPSLDNLNGTTGGPVFFTSDGLFFHFNNVHDSPPHNYGYNFAGDQILYVDFACTSVPRTDPFDRLVLSRCGIQAIDPHTREIVWEFDVGSTTVRPAIDGQGRVFTSTFLGHLTAVDADGQFLWESSDAVDVAGVLGARDGRVVYRAPGFGDPTIIGIADADGGALLGSANLTMVGIDSELVESDRIAFSPDGRTAYFSTRFTRLAAPGAIYAVRVGDSCAADIDGDGDADGDDFFGFLDLFAAGDARADVDDDGDRDADDFFAYLDLFSQGC